MSAVSPKAALIQSFRSRRIVNGTGFEPLMLPGKSGSPFVRTAGFFALLTLSGLPRYAWQ